MDTNMVLKHIQEFPDVPYTYLQGLSRATNTLRRKYATDYAVDIARKVSAILMGKILSGSGFDGSKVDLLNSTDNELVIDTSFRHKNENKYDNENDKWTHHEITITPHLTNSFSLKITGEDRNGIKLYIQDALSDILNQPAPHLAQVYAYECF